jgi:hypothetical protein
VELDELFRKICGILTDREIVFAVGGGLAVSLYRAELRATRDIDILILAGEESLDLACGILRSLGLVPGVARKADLEGGPKFLIEAGTSEPQMVVGRPKGDPHGIGVDFLLPPMPWVPDAIRRAQDNRVDYGFGAVPAITIEDAVLAKLAALGASGRAKDADDLESMFAANPPLDVEYLAGQMRKLAITVPVGMKNKAPEILAKVSRDIEKEIRKRSRQQHASPRTRGPKRHS